MKVILDAALFGEGQSHALELLSLIQLGFEGRHFVTTEPLEDPRISGWLAARGRVEADCCQLAFNAAITELSRSHAEICIRVEPGHLPPSFHLNECSLSIQDALAFLRSPFRILLEDETRDGTFVLAIAKPEWRKRLLEMRSKGWVRFEHGGGITRMLETIRGSLASPLARVNLWVLFDSDSLSPGRPSQQATRMINLCSRNVAFHCLERRAVENYVPLPALEHWTDFAHRDSANRKRTLRAFRAMDPICRFHYNLKRGFLGDAARDDFENVGNLYSDLSPQSRQSLDHGFDERIATLFQWYGWSNWEWWINSGGEREEGSRIIQKLFSRL